MRHRTGTKKEREERLFRFRTLVANYENERGIGSVSKETGIPPIRLMTILDGVLEPDKSEETNLKRLLEVTSLYA